MYKRQIKYGGHAQAGGFSLKQENLPAFMERYNEFFCTHYPLSTWVPTVDCDVLLTPEDVTAVSYTHLICAER